MRKLFAFFVVALVSFGLSVNDADARRFGGGSSFGKQRQSFSRQALPQKPVQAPAAAPAPSRNRWLGPLAGLAAGGLLASLFMGHGFDGIKGLDILLILLLAGGAFFIIRALRRTPAPSMQAAPYAGAGTFDGMADRAGAGAMAGDMPATPSFGGRPAGFQDEAYLREAKGHFIRLQAANDAKDLNDIREYTTPAVFSEIALQMQERGEQPQKTEVVTLNADMVDVVTEGDLVIASVRFSGLIREEAGAGASPFDEVWHIQKSLSQPNANWYIAGIQQVQ
ncbi:MAG: Tim44 domain-containing protein [Burkholderiales bacterium]